MDKAVDGWTCLVTPVSLNNYSTADSALPEEMKSCTNVNMAKPKRNDVVGVSWWNCETEERFLHFSEHKTASVIHIASDAMSPEVSWVTHAITDGEW